MIAGKGMFIWKISNTEGGDGKAAAEKAYEAGFTHVWVKVLNGTWRYNQRPYYNSNGDLRFADDILKPFIDEFKKLGILVYGWTYNYLYNPALEAQRVHERIEELGLDGFLFDVEGAAKNKFVQARTFLARVQDIKIPMGLSTYRFPTLHDEAINFPDWMEICDFVAPQVYWLFASNPREQLIRSIREWRAITDKPIIPTGAAYTEFRWAATASQVLEFLQTAYDTPEIEAANFWVWNHAVKLGLWQPISEFPWPVSGTDPDPDPVGLMPWKRVLRYKVFNHMTKNGYSGKAPDILGE